MDNTKLKELEVDQRIARLREKNKMLEERHKMLEDEKRQAQAQSSKQNDGHFEKQDNQRFKAYMDKPNESFKKNQPSTPSRQFSNSKAFGGRGHERSRQHHKDDRRSTTNRFYKGVHHRHEDTSEEDHKKPAPNYFTNPLLNEDSDQPFNSGRKSQPGNSRGMKKYNNPRKTEKKEQPTQPKRNDEDHQRWLQQREQADHERMMRFQNKGQRDWDSNKSNNTNPWGDCNQMSSHYQHDSRDAPDEQEDHHHRSEHRHERNNKEASSHHGHQQSRGNRGGDGGHTPRSNRGGNHRGRGRGGEGRTPSSAKSPRNIPDHGSSDKEGGEVVDLRIKLNQMRNEKSQDDSTTKKKTRQQQQQRRRNKSSNHNSLSESSSTGPQYGNNDDSGGKTLNNKDEEVFEEQHQQNVLATSASIDHLLDDTPDVTDWALEVEMNSPSYQNKQFDQLHGEEHNNEWHPASFENLSISVSDKGKKERRRVTGKSGQH